MPHGKTALQAFDERIGPDDPAREALAQRFGELKELQAQGDPAFQPGSRFFAGRHGKFVEEVLGHLDQTQGPPPPPGAGGVGGGAALSFAQTEAGARLAASLARDTERISGRERLKLEDTLQSLATELLPPGDVETAMKQVRRGELVKSKLAFQAVLQNLSDAAQNAERRRDLALAEENEKRTLRNARARITIDMVGRDLGRAVLFALAGTGGGEE
ncbi:hypothetical protein LCGC14_1646220 [marine sediment metagenome]|uniref:Uncharacterized protein n=1 Tax=marine sediment metagenome TaxID=412755 RepID=A0A0F9KY41_9ZZZZ